MLGGTVDAIAREKLAVAKEGAIVVLPDETYAHLVEANEVRIGGAREAAEAFLGRTIEARPEVSLAGRLERREGEVETVLTIPTVSATWSSGFPRATTRSWSRSWRTRTPTRCCASFVVWGRVSWPRGRRLHVRFRPRSSPTSRVATSPTSKPWKTPAPRWRGRTRLGGPSS